VVFPLSLAVRPKIVACGPTTEKCAAYRLSNSQRRCQLVPSERRFACSADQPVGTWHDLSLPPVMRRALQLIEARLAEPFVVPTFAHELGVSHNQLLRLFHNSAKAQRCPIAQLIQDGTK